MSHSRIKRWLLYAALLGSTLFLMVCTNPMVGTSVEDREDLPGSLVVDIESSISKTLVPDLDMDPAQYGIYGTGPNAGSFSTTSDTPPVTIPGLHFGDWTVTVEALNAEGIVIGRCQEVVTIHSGVTANFSAVVRPLEGYGSVDLAVTWPAEDTENPVVRAQLVPKVGSPIDLSFTISAPGTAVCTAGNIPTGYYTLMVQLYDQLLIGDQLAIGAVEIARIVKDQTTVGVFDFPVINDPAGALEVNITPELENPIPVTLSGQLASIDEGQTMTVTATVPPEVGNAVYAWYLNGIAAATGASYTTAADLEAGTYRLDVTAYSADGARAGSASCSFTVNGTLLTQATLEWDPNCESDLAGYRLYYGESSGSYTASVDVGNCTSCTLTDLVAGRIYYIAATAYNESGLESGYSNEVVFSGS
ncbi:MAG: fibronectin type III domain-containing protein [Spirochaetales bacterium]|nr:fibronectin type III domain-containing protein [Spirochaetales bacterium]